MDLTAKKVSVYQDGEFIEFKVPGGAKQATWRAVIFIGSGLMMIGLFIVLGTSEWLRIRRESKAEQPEN